MGNLNTKNVLKLPAKITDSVYASLEDGDFNFLTDFQNFIDDFIAVKPAIDSIKEMKEENLSMSIEERKDLQTSIVAEMPNVNEDDSFDIASGLTGVLSMFRIGWRKGATAERAKLKAELKAGTLTIESLLAEEE